MEIQSILNYPKRLKSPFEKGGFRGISGGYKIPPNPPLGKGGKKTALVRLQSRYKNLIVNIPEIGVLWRWVAQAEPGANRHPRRRGTE